MSADLHIHTNISDGCLSPSEVVHIGAKIGLKAVAITDHDTMDGVAEALQEGKKVNINVVPGVELSTEYMNIEIHILGYYVDCNNKEFQLMLEKLRICRLQRVKNMVKKLNSLGCKVNLEEVMVLTEKGGAVGRPHVARILTKKGYVNNVQDAFDRYIGCNAPAYVEKYKLTPYEVIKMVLKAGGVPLLAHPGLIRNDDIALELIKEGLRGIEVYHPKHNDEQVRKYLAMALSHDLLLTGGSDCHDIDRLNGSEIGSVTVSMYHVEKLKKAAEKIKLEAGMV